MKKKFGFAFTGSFCCHEAVLKEFDKLINKGFDIQPLITGSVKTTDTRFGKACDLITHLERKSGKRVISTITEAEPLGPKNLIDAIIIAPCTGNTLAKLANGISDNAVTMATKSLMRNGKPVIIGISSNDALGLNLQNIAKLLNTKGVYFVPFRQDNFEAKPKSLVARWDLIEKTVRKAMTNYQIQPIIN